MKAYEPKWVKPILSIITVNSLRLQINVKYGLYNVYDLIAMVSFRNKWFFVEHITCPKLIIIYYIKLFNKAFPLTFNKIFSKQFFSNIQLNITMQRHYWKCSLLIIMIFKKYKGNDKKKQIKVLLILLHITWYNFI